jgi:pimeloyl-ACP methyl ester carboxylesterase
MPWHWWSAVQAGDATNILRKLEETVAWARRRLRADRFILVGHSAGGLVARLYLHEQPVWGQVYAGAEHASSVIFLGTPHCCHRKPGSPEAPGTDWFLVDAANRWVPGGPYAELTSYHTVVGCSIKGRRRGSLKERRAFRIYRMIGESRGDVWGDGVVPVDQQRLDGAETLVLRNVSHSLKVGPNWNGGSRAVIREWWFAGATDAG